MASQDSRNVRPLLPAPHAATPTSLAASLSARFEPTAGVPPRKRGKQVTLACDACKRRKSRCDGRRPVCVACERKSTDCYYDELGREQNKVASLKQQNSTLSRELEEKAEILRFLIEAKREDAHHYLDEYRREQIGALCSAGTSRPGSSSIDSLTAVSASSTDPSVSASSRFVSDIPDQNESFARSDDGSTDNPFHSHAVGSIELFELARQAGLVNNVSQIDSEEGAKFTFSITVTKPPDPHVQTPLIPQLRQLGDGLPDLDPLDRHQPFLSLQAHPWTTVTDNDCVFSRLVCLWLSYHARCVPYVYPTAFIEGLKSGQPTEHCSRLLVNAILALACHYSTEIGAQGPPDQPLLRGYDFYQDALHLWQLEDCRPSVATAQALIAMYEFNKLRGKDRVGWALLQSAIEMSIDLGIFQRPLTETARTEQEFANDFAAWGIFMYLAIESLMFCKLPPVRRCFAPRGPIPLRQSELTEKWRPFGIVGGVKLDSCFWEHWRSLCSLSEIIVDAARVLVGDGATGFGIPSLLVAQQAEELIAELVHWRAKLPSALSLEKNEMPHNLWLHMTYHMVILKVYQPKRSLAEADLAKNNVVNASKAIIHLAAIATERYGYDLRTAYDSQICAAAAFALVHDLNIESSRASLLQCTEMLHAQAGRFLLAGALARSILLVAQGVGQEWPEIISALNISMMFDSFTLKSLNRPTPDDIRQAHSHLARFVSSRFPSTISVSRESFGDGAAAGGGKLDELLISLGDLQLRRGS